MSSTDGAEVLSPSERIVITVRQRIADGTYAPGSRLPGRRTLMSEFSTADRTVGVAMAKLRDEGLIYVVAGGGWYVRATRSVVRSTRSRLSRAERAAGRGAFSTDCEAAGLAPDVTVTIETGTASEEVAGQLDIEPGAEVVLRERVMRAGGEVLQLATSYLPRSISAGTAMEQSNSGPGGIYARLEERGYELTSYTERVAIGRASEHEARQMGLTPGDPVFRVIRTAWSGDQAVEVNHITITSDRYELLYELPAT